MCVHNLGKHFSDALKEQNFKKCFLFITAYIFPELYNGCMFLSFNWKIKLILKMQVVPCQLCPNAMENQLFKEKNQYYVIIFKLPFKTFKGDF